MTAPSKACFFSSFASASTLQFNSIGEHLLHGISDTIKLSISGTDEQIGAPCLETSRVMLQPIDSFNARMAGPDIIISPILSVRIHNNFLQERHASFMYNCFYK